MVHFNTLVLISRYNYYRFIPTLNKYNDEKVYEMTINIGTQKLNIASFIVDYDNLFL